MHGKSFSAANAILRSLLIFIILFSPSFSVRGQTQSGQQPALILFKTPSREKLEKVVGSLSDYGIQVYSTLPNQAAMVWMEPAQADAIRRLPYVRKVSFDPVSLTEDDGDSGAEAAILSWNQRFSKEPINTHVKPHIPPGGDARSTPKKSKASLAPASTLPSTPDTSEFMLRSLHVDVFLLESNGKLDVNTENWTDAQIDNVQREVTSGINWWVDTERGSRPSSPVRTDIQFHSTENEPSIVSIDYEPINHPSYDEGVWIGNIMSHLGSDSSMDYYSSVAQYNLLEKQRTGTDWSFSVFVVNSQADEDGMFTDRTFAYAYVNGPFVVITYDNDNWTIDNMEIVMAHEMGHIFGALDEYAGSNCTQNETSGYLNIANSNCENGGASESSIMRDWDIQLNAYPNHQASTPARQMIGWRDEDGDGIYDPIDTNLNFSLTSSPTSPITISTPSWSGAAQELPYKSQNPQLPTVSVNNIISVEYQLDSSTAWYSCIAKDGAFDDQDETFNCTTHILEDGTHTISFHAINTSGNSSLLLSKQFIVDADSPTVPNEISLDCKVQSDAWQNSCSGSSFTWSGAQAVEPSTIAGYNVYWGQNASGETPSTYVDHPGFLAPSSPNNITYLRIQTRDSKNRLSPWKTLFILKHDNVLPAASLSLESSQVSGPFQVHWNGTDNLSGIASYDVQYRLEGESNWSDWMIATSEDKAAFGPELPGRSIQITPGMQIYFRVRATDQAGNLGEYSTDEQKASMPFSGNVFLPLLIR